MKTWTRAIVLALFMALLLACRGPERPGGSTPSPVLPAVMSPTPPGSSTASPTPAVATTPTPSPVPTLVPLATRTTITAKSQALSTGSSAPEFQLALLDGAAMRLSDLRGKVVVLNFWASWCAPCRWEMPAFERVWQEYKDKGVIFVGVAVADREQDAKAFAGEVGVTYSLGMDASGEIASAYQIVGLPTTYFIDRQGRISRVLTGAANEGALRVFLNGQLGGK